MAAETSPTPGPEADTQMGQDARDASTPTPEEPVKAGRKRPRIDMATDAGQRKRGKSMFALALGTLTRAKNEDRARNQSDAAKKRQEIEQRLQEKLRKETDSVRRAEEAKKDKTAANRKEEELQLKDSIYKLRRTRLPTLANFLITSDTIPDILIADLDRSASPAPPAPITPDEDDDRTEPAQDAESKNLATATTRASRAPALAGPPRSHPPPLYYLPAILTPAQEAFLKRRNEQVKAAADAEWTAFAAERSAGIAEISRLRQRVAEEGARTKGQSKTQDDVELPDAPTESTPEKPLEELKADISPKVEAAPETARSEKKDVADDAKMEVDGEAAKGGETKAAEKPAPPQVDEDDAVEY